MSYCIPIEVKTLSNTAASFKDFIKRLNARNSSMIFLSESCYSLLKNNSVCIEQKNSKVFSQEDTNKKTKSFIETINIDSSNCSFLKSIFSNDYIYEYKNGIPKKILLIITEDEDLHDYQDIFASVIVTNDSESSVDCIINNPSAFENSVVFLTSKSYNRLKANTNTISNFYCLERLLWAPDDKYPGGNVMLHCINNASLYLIYHMSFPFFTKNFSFNQIPQSIFFIE